jgi:hypothetical protein
MAPSCLKAQPIALGAVLLGCASTPVPPVPRPSVTAPVRAPSLRVAVSFGSAPQRPVTGAFDADGRRVATIGEDGELAVWAIDASRTIARFPQAVPKGSDKPRVVWDGKDALVIVTAAALLRAELASQGITTLPGASADVSPDGRRAARVLDASAGIVEIVDTRDGHAEARLTTRLSGVAVVGWIDRHQALAFRDKSGHLEVWATDTGTRRARCAACGARGEAGSELDGALGTSPDGRFFSSRRWDLDRTGRRVDVLDASTGRVRASLKSCGFRVAPDQVTDYSSLTWSPDGRHAALVCSHIDTVPTAGVFFSTDLYDTASWLRLAMLGGDVRVANAFAELAFSADGSRLFTWSTSNWDGEALDAATGKRWTMVPGTGGRPGPDGHLALGEDGFVRAAETLRVVAGWGDSGFPLDLAFRDDDGALAVLADDRLAVWPLGSGASALAAAVATDGLRWTGRGELLATDTADWWPWVRWRRFDASSGDLRSWSSRADAPGVLNPAGTARLWIRPCAGAAARPSASGACPELVISEPDGKRPRVIERGVVAERVELAWSPDGASLGVADETRGLRTYDAASGAPRRALERPLKANGFPSRLAVANGGARMAVALGGDSPALVVADLATTVELALAVHEVDALGWTMDGRYLFAHGRGTALIVVDATTLKVVRSIAMPLASNKWSLASRDIPRLMAHGGGDVWRRLERALACCGGDRAKSYGPCALSSDGRLVARAVRETIELVRVADGARLELEEQWLAQPVRLISDGSGRFDCDDAALAHVLVKAPGTAARPLASAAPALARRVPGLLASFVAGR